jgi:hypothetical protein
MLDRLRQSTLDEEPEEEDLGIDVIKAAEAEEDLIFGLNPVQRLVLSIFLFLNVSVLGCALLLIMGRVHLDNLF